MKRFLIFALLGPVLTIIVWLALFVWIVVSLAGIAAFPIPPMPIALQILAWCFVVALVPAVGLAVLDRLLAARFGVLPRIISTASAGYIVALLAALTAYDRSIWLETLLFGLIGAIPAAVCSWLSHEKQHGEAQFVSSIG